MSAEGQEEPMETIDMKWLRIQQRQVPWVRMEIQPLHVEAMQRAEAAMLVREHLKAHGLPRALIAKIILMAGN